MAVELSKLYDELRVYKVSGSDNCYIFRHEYRDLSIKSYKWHLIVSLREVDKMGNVLSQKDVFDCKNYTRDSNQRRFYKFLLENNYSLELMSRQQSFLTKDKLNV